MSENCVIKTENLSKEYRLGLIGTGTLKNDLQSKFAKMRGKPDPNLRIGAKEHEKNERFLALDGVSVEINRGDRVGIIGANGAGKSTFLKLLARITSPTDGQFCYRGRITSMLEVGTGFHGELTGRENIYLNGAILGMNRSEVDRKIDKIIEFSECEKFIDTPVKRYSSGMFVKLAFAVASHLDSEIMIMDEVLAVGDMKFQKKCISKMRDLAIDENRTVLYVSHNMNTIQELCNRCIVLDHGKKIFDGGVDEAIKLYFGGEKDEFYSFEYTEKRKNGCDRQDIDLKRVKYFGKTNNFFYDNEKIPIEMTWENKADIPNLSLRIELSNIRRQPVTSFIIENFYSGKKGETHTQKLKLDVSNLAIGGYYTRYVFYNRLDPTQPFETVEDARGLNFNKRNSEKYQLPWKSSWGSVMTDGIELEK
ncbi:MAG: ABC transporter ATP-binding protein [Ruminococcus sp.]|nr:ABC transporter ATP-binding protein [Ruminococcus sp.]